MNPIVGVIMGSTSDWETMKHACDILEELEIPYEKKVVSAHRTPDLMFEYAESAQERGIKVIIAGAGGAAHLPGMIAAKTIVASYWCACSIESIEWNGFLIIYCSNARRRSSGYSCYWKSWSNKCRFTCSTNSWNTDEDIAKRLKLYEMKQKKKC